ncbi:hypothetical protein TRIP_C20227 [Candidatus Zixiibacteriota bacterium]|nr:hypothetical protein TRIP_C20227 [candidate division Zixibacteria bacterium]
MSIASSVSRGIFFNRSFILFPYQIIHRFPAIYKKIILRKRAKLIKSCTMPRRKRKSLFSLFRRDKNRPSDRGDLLSRLSNSDQKFRRILFRVTAVMVIIFMGYAFFSGTFGFIHIAKLRAHKQDLIDENQRLLVKLIDADIARDRLQHDWYYIEYIARTKHLLSRPGEVIYRFKE